MIVFPNAKINIGLNVVEKRNDGFHNIESIFYPISNLVDILEIIAINKNVDSRFYSTGIPIHGNLDDNLCLKAYQLLQEAYNIPSVSIHLHKLIPIGAGLGGGSSDAAFTLKVLNILFKLKLNDDKLIDFAKKLGSDCAFFIKNKPVYAYAKGDEFQSINLNLSNYTIKIKHPTIHIGTAQAYNGIIPTPSNFELKNIENIDISLWKNHVKNDFETTIFKIHPKIKEVKDSLYKQGAIYASMTGSGSSVYGIFKN